MHVPFLRALLAMLISSPRSSIAVFDPDVTETLHDNPGNRNEYPMLTALARAAYLEMVALQRDPTEDEKFREGQGTWDRTYATTMTALLTENTVYFSSPVKGREFVYHLKKDGITRDAGNLDQQVYTALNRCRVFEGGKEKKGELLCLMASVEILHNGGSLAFRRLSGGLRLHSYSTQVWRDVRRAHDCPNVPYRPTH